MSFDPKTGNQVYSIDDLLGLARLNNFGRHSSVIYSALIDLLRSKEHIKIITRENEELRGQIAKMAVLTSQVEEIHIFNKENIDNQPSYLYGNPNDNY